ncbi:MAG: SDR family oxidoreductase [Myxococcales bacterium]|nr:SDR family oxidoreductase [Myxococcales bacterium]
MVTGAGGGIGRCVAHELSSLGAQVVLSGRTEAKLEAVARELAPRSTEILTLDIRRPEAVDSAFSALSERIERLHGLVNCAGGQFAAPASSISQRGFDAVIETNLRGTWACCRAAYDRFFAMNGGAIVNVTADHRRGMPMMAHSGAARAGVENLTMTLAIEWASQSVRVNAVAPGIIQSSGLDTYPEPVQTILRELPAQLPMGRFGTVAEVSAAVGFLLSTAASYITGATLHVDGGSSLMGPLHPRFRGQPTSAYHGWDDAD